MSKFRNEPCIQQRKGKKGLWSFTVQIKMDGMNIVRTFSEKRYGTAKIAYDQAVKFKYDTLIEIRNKTLLLGSTITVNEIFEKFLETTTDSFATKKRIISNFNKYVDYKDKPVSEITRADIQLNLNSLVEKASNDTIGRVYTLWKNFIIGTAIMFEYINKDVTLGVKKPESHLISIKKKTDTCKKDIKEVEQIILRRMVNKYHAQLIVYLLELLYFTGMRPGEALALNKSDIHADYISITKEIGSNMNEENVIRRCKTPTSVRDIPISPLLKPILYELLKFSKTEEIFKKEDGTYMTSTWIGNAIRTYLKGTDIEFNLYRLRHNMATELISNKVDSRTTMDILGHSNFGTSLYYANSSKEQKEDAIELLS